MTKEKRNSFVFYASFWEAIKEVPRDVQGEVLTAIIEYGLYGETTEQLKPIARAMFLLIKPQLDANYSRFKNGKKGGRPARLVTKEEPNNNQDKTKIEPNEDENYNVNEDEDDNVGRNFPLDPEIEKRIGLNSLKPLNEVFNELDNNQQWKEAICMNHSIPGSTVQIRLNNLKILLNEFYNHLSGDMQVKEKSLQDTYSHFSNWLRKKKEYERK